MAFVGCPLIALEFGGGKQRFFESFCSSRKEHITSFFSADHLPNECFVRYVSHDNNRVEGTGTPITVSTCHQATEIKVKFSVFTGSCANLECVSGTDEPDYACPLLRRENELGEWNTLATAHTFETELDKRYYILVQGVNGSRGEVWLNFRFPDVPQNDNCVDAIGPVPRDLTMIENSSIDATVSKEYDYCEANVPALYPGTWFQSKFILSFVLLETIYSKL